MKTLTTRLVSAVLVTGLVMPSAVLAQPAPDKDKKDDKNPADEADKMYSCNKRTGPIAVTFKPETELKDQMVRYILHPSYAQVETIRGALEAIRSQAGSVQAAGNLLIITDYSSQVRDMLTLAKALDVPGNNEGIFTIPVLHADAQQLATKVND